MEKKRQAFHREEAEFLQSLGLQRQPGYLYRVVNHEDSLGEADVERMLLTIGSFNGSTKLQEAIVRATLNCGHPVSLEAVAKCFTDLTEREIRWLLINHLSSYPHADVAARLPELFDHPGYRKMYSDLTGRSI